MSSRFEEVAQKSKAKRDTPHEPQIKPYKSDNVGAPEPIKKVVEIEPPTKLETDEKAPVESKKEIKSQTLYLDDLTYNTFQLYCKTNKLKINNIINEFLVNFLREKDPNGEYRAQALEMKKIINKLKGNESNE